jgi:hypothetical protein
MKESPYSQQLSRFEQERLLYPFEIVNPKKHKKRA